MCMGSSFISRLLTRILNVSEKIYEPWNKSDNYELGKEFGINENILSTTCYKSARDLMTSFIIYFHWRDCIVF